MGRKIFNKIPPVMALLFVITLIFNFSDNMAKLDYILAVIALGAQALSLWLFYITEPRWGSWLIKRAGGLYLYPDVNPIKLAEDGFFFFNILIFGILLPFSLYLNRPMGGQNLSNAFIFAILTWYHIFCSPLHLILTGQMENSAGLWRTPLISLAGLLLVLWFYPLPYDATVVTLVLLWVFCLEIVLILVLRGFLSKNQ